VFDAGVYLLEASVRKRIGRLMRILVLGRFFQHLAPFLAVAGLLGGTVVLAVRRLLPAAVPYLQWVWLLPGVSILAAVAVSFYRRPARSTCLALADKLGRADGLLLAVAQSGDPRWAERLPLRLRSFPLPVLRFPPNGFLAVAALAFFCASFAVPARAPERFATPLQEKLRNLLEQEAELAKELPLARKENLPIRKALEKLKEKTRRKVDAATLDEIDQVIKRLARSLLKREEELKNLEKELASLLERLKKRTATRAGAGSSSSRVANAPAGAGICAALSTMAQKFEGAGLGGTLSKQAQAISEKLRRGISAGLSPEDLKRLAEELLKACRSAGKRLGSCKSRLWCLAESARCLGCGRSSYGLAKRWRYRKERKAGSPGRGGIDRGPGPAPLLFGKKAPRVSLKPQPVAPRVIVPSEKDVFLTEEARPDVPAADTGRSAVAGRHTSAAVRGPSDVPIPPSRLETVKRYFRAASPGAGQNGGKGE